MKESGTILYLPKMRPLPPRRSTVVSVLDIGTTKLCCLIARLIPRENENILPGRSHSIQLLGFAHKHSRGIKSGVVVDMEKAELAVRECVDSAERMAGTTVSSVIVSLSCGRLKSRIHSASVGLERRSVNERDIQRVLAAGSSQTIEPGRAVTHVLPVGYSLDGDAGIRDPRGMVGNELGVDIQIVTNDIPPVRNLELCLNRSHLQVETMVATPYASGLSTVVDDEAELGVACVDLGGGTATLAVFLEQRMVHLDALALGGHHVTMDIARALSTSIRDAERLKILQGSALPSAADDRDFLSVPAVDRHSGPPVQVPRALLTRIIRPRMEEILEITRDRLRHSGFAPRIGKRIVFTGGASQLTGLSEVARRILGRHVRLGRPLGVQGLPEAAKGPAFSAAVGLLIYPQLAGTEQFEIDFARHGWRRGQNYLARIGHWIKESF